MEKCFWRVIPSHSSVQPLPFPFIFCSPSTCTDQYLCTQMPGELIPPCPQYYLLGFFSCHFITSVCSILPFFFFFAFILNFLRINLESVRNGHFSMYHLEITWSQKFAVFAHHLPWRWRAAVLFLWKAEEKWDQSINSFLSYMYSFCCDFCFVLFWDLFLFKLFPCSEL